MPVKISPSKKPYERLDWMTRNLISCFIIQNRIEKLEDFPHYKA